MKMPSAKTNEGVIRVTDMHTLEQEKARLRKLCKEMENEFQLRFDHIKENSGTMAFNAIFPNISKGSGIWGTIIQIVKNGWNSGYAKTILFSALITLIEFLGAKFGMKYLSKLFKKEKKNPETEYDY